MNLTAPIVYNSLSINTVTTSSGGRPSSGYQVEGFDWLPVSARTYMENRALQDGANAGSVYLGPQPLQLIVSVFGSTSGDFWDKVQNLRAAFSPTLAYAADTASRGFLPLTYYRPTADISTWPTSTYPYGIPLQLGVRASGPVSAAIRRDAIGGTRGIAARYVVPLAAKFPFAVSQSETTASISLAILTSSGNTTATNRGDYPAFPTFTVTPIASGSSQTVSLTYGAAVFIIAATATGAYTLDVANRTLTRAGVSVISSLLSSTVWDTLDPGSNNISASSNPAGNITVRVGWRDTYA